MEYNTQREKLKITDYGRNVCKLIEFAKTIQDKEKRNQAANVIISVMSQVNPHAKDNVDYKHKLWDHLMILSNFELDVDCPYPITRENTVHFTPERLKYKNHRIRFRHHGKFMENMIQKVIEYPDGEEKDFLIELIAHHLKKSYLTWNRDTVSDDLIYEQFNELSKGKLKLNENFQLLHSREYITPPTSTSNNIGNPNRPKKKTNLQRNTNNSNNNNKQKNKYPSQNNSKKSYSKNK